MTVRHVASDPQALIKGVREFNSWRFYDCHETLEDVWRAESSALADFYQGIIKVAAGFHHLLRRNHKGAVNLLAGGLAYLEGFRPSCLGIDVERLVDEVGACHRKIVELGSRRMGEFDRSLIPRIEFDPEALGG